MIKVTVYLEDGNSVEVTHFDGEESIETLVNNYSNKLTDSGNLILGGGKKFQIIPLKNISFINFEKKDKPEKFTD